MSRNSLWNTFAVVVVIVVGSNPAGATQMQVLTVPPIAVSGAGDSTDPHISDPWVTYTNRPTPISVTVIRVHNLVDGRDLMLPQSPVPGTYDFLAGVDGSRVVFTRVDPTHSSIQLYDVSSGTVTELAPDPNSFRQSASVGGNTVAWQDFGFDTTGNGYSDIVAYNLMTGSVTRLTNGQSTNQAPVVSPDGMAIVWETCADTCNVSSATQAGGVWTARALTGNNTGQSHPSSDGTLVAYAATRIIGGTSQMNIYLQPVGGGHERRIDMPGLQSNPMMSDGIVVFESRSSPTANADIYAYDSRADVIYQVTNTANASETLAAVSAKSGEVTVVWQVMIAGQYIVQGAQFMITCLPASLPFAVATRTGVVQVAEIDFANQTPSAGSVPGCTGTFKVVAPTPLGSFPIARGTFAATTQGDVTSANLVSSPVIGSVPLMATLDLDAIAHSGFFLVTSNVGGTSVSLEVDFAQSGVDYLLTGAHLQ